MPKKNKTLCVDDLRHAEYYGILPYFMIIFISISTRVLLSMQMRLLFW